MRRYLPGLLLVSPALAIIVLLFLVPLGGAVTGAFQDPDGGFSFGNFVKTFELYRTDILFTVVIVLLSALLTAVLSIAVAGYLTLGSNPLAVAILRWLYRWPLFIPFIVVGWVYANAGDAKTLEQGPFKPDEKADWSKALESLKEFNQNVTFTPGNAGTLDMLARGEIAMGPVWVDMFYTWQASGQLPPDLKLILPSPGMPGQPMHYVIPAKAEHAKLAEKFIALATSPDVQANGIVKKFNWYPGIDADKVQSKLDPETWNKLFTDIKPDELAAKGKPFPIKPYFDGILEAYEKQVAN
jgi:ABC-type glycerol-3-phosphate transport system substrate-binding protein